MSKKIIRVGGASGYWGDMPDATPQLVEDGVDYLVYDLLAELNVPILARMREGNPDMGYALDFADRILKPSLIEIARKGVKVLANAGGLNPRGCGESVRRAVKELGLNLKVAVVLGDDVVSRKEEFFKRGDTEMFSGKKFPAPDRVIGANAYFGAFPMAKALAEGADIVITGRAVDSAATLAACIHAFGWNAEEVDKLSGGSLAGHILECGTQATGGNFTDWELVADQFDRLGYPIAEISSDGTFICTKPKGTGGLVSVGTITEQMIYEIGDPQAYMLPDVVCDFSQLEIKQVGEHRVSVSNAKGYSAPDTYKTCVSYADGYKAALALTLYGGDAEKKAEVAATSILRRCTNQFRAKNMPDFYETSVEVTGAEHHYGASRRSAPQREVDLKVAVAHETLEGAGALMQEFVGMALAQPPGMCAFSTGPVQPMPITRVYSFLLPKAEVKITVEVEGKAFDFKDAPGKRFEPASLKRPAAPEAPAPFTDGVKVPLVKLAYGRSGDKGEKSNIGVIARKPEYMPYIYAALTESNVATYMAHFNRGKVERFPMPGPNAFNILLDDILAGGAAGGLRADAMGKGYGQLLLDYEIPVPRAFAEKHGLLSKAAAE